MSSNLVVVVVAVVAAAAVMDSLLMVSCCLREHILVNLPPSWLAALSPSAMPRRFEMDGREGLFVSSCECAAGAAGGGCGARR
jgi:hypothetical protein